MNKKKLARRLIRVAANVMAQDEPEEMDPKFVEKVRSLKKSLPRLASKKKRKLSQYGIGTIKATSTVEDLVNALMKVASG